VRGVAALPLPARARDVEVTPARTDTCFFLSHIHTHTLVMGARRRLAYALIKPGGSRCRVASMRGSTSSPKHCKRTQTMSGPTLAVRSATDAKGCCLRRR
jgi:hypothetical protein